MRSPGRGRQLDADPYVWSFTTASRLRRLAVTAQPPANVTAGAASASRSRPRTAREPGHVIHRQRDDSLGNNPGNGTLGGTLSVDGRQWRGDLFRVNARIRPAAATRSRPAAATWPRDHGRLQRDRGPGLVPGFQRTTDDRAAGTPFNFSLTAYDAYGNVAAGYTGMVHFTSTDTSATLPANYTFTTGNAGTAAFSATLKSSGAQTITATDTVTSSITGKGSLTVSSSGGPTTAMFLKQDMTTQGNWINTYGRQGYEVISNATSLPSYASVTASGETTYTWTTNTTDPRRLEDAGGVGRIASVWYANTSFTVAVNLSDGKAHNLELYFVDWDNKGRGQQIQISSSTGTVLDTETIASFGNGVYLDWTVSGNVVIKITETKGASAVLSGLFIDPTAVQTPTITWSNPANIVYGAALSGTQLDATASVAGSFAYTPAAGTVLKAGNNQKLSVTFTPTDTTDYSSTTATVPINVLAGDALDHLVEPCGYRIGHGAIEHATRRDELLDGWRDERKRGGELHLQSCGGHGAGCRRRSNVVGDVHADGYERLHVGQRHGEDQRDGAGVGVGDVSEGRHDDAGELDQIRTAVRDTR